MKNKIGIAVILVLLSVSNVAGQCNEMLVDTTKKWSALTSGQFPWHFYYSYAHRFANEITIGDKTFREVLYSEDPQYAFWTPVGLVYEDNESRVFAYDFVSDTIRLLYDFGVRQHDTIKFHFFQGYHYMGNYFITAHVDSVDSVFFADKYRKRIQMTYIYDKKYFGSETWIEGIGSLLGVMNTGKGDWVGTADELLCYWEKGVLKYGSYCYASNVGIGEEHLSAANVTVCPNPVSFRSVLKIDSRQPFDFFTIEIFSASGIKIVSKKLKQVNHFEIRKEDFQKGVYAFTIITSNGERINGKFVVI